ncbi:MAG: dTDP-4-amino-4,6-dideoxygalactose transaminase [Nitrospinales bacterium]
MNLKADQYRIPFNKPFIIGKELYYMAQAVVDLHLSGNGPFTQKCNKWLEDKLDTKKALLTTSCTDALEMAALLADIKAGDEIIMPSFTFVSTANAFVLRGAIPVFIDIRPDTLNIDEMLIESAITEKTKAIVPVHYAGVSCEMKSILDIAERHNLLVIEDAAQGLLSKSGGQYLGTLGHFGCLSFHETKNIISGEGGALLINDPAFISRAEIIWEKGTNRKQFGLNKVQKYSWVDIGSSFYPSELVGAFLYAQFEHAEKINIARRKIFQRYYQALELLERKDFLRRPHINNESDINGHIFYIITNSENQREELIQFLDEKGINCVFHYVPLHSSIGGLKYGKFKGELTNTDSVSNRLLRLPIFYEMSDDELTYVIEALYKFYEQK